MPLLDLLQIAPPTPILDHLYARHVPLRVLPDLEGATSGYLRKNFAGDSAKICRFSWPLGWPHEPGHSGGLWDEKSCRMVELIRFVSVGTFRARRLQKIWPASDAAA